MKYIPQYLTAYRNGSFPAILTEARKLLKKCRVCPRNCGVNRTAGELGDCQVGYEPIVSSYFPHFGEEAPLIGSSGSGTIFMAGCNLHCLFCQNYETSHFLEGRAADFEKLANIMLSLQENGCHNINIVTPSHVVPQLLESLYIAVKKGLDIPLVYNSGGYDGLDSLRLLNGIVDIYMPDFKFFSDELAAKYLEVSDYATVCKSVLREMHRQVGDLVIENGLAVRGLLIRHLVMPNHLENSKKIFEFISAEISPDTYLNVMPQYHPAGDAHRHPEINRSLAYDEYQEAVKAARKLITSRKL